MIFKARLTEKFLLTEQFIYPAIIFTIGFALSKPE
jgi:hypothetical protein